MKNRTIIFLALSSLLLFSCDRADRVDHSDSKYIYVWKYDGDDSVLVKYSQPVYLELNVMGGHHKNHHIKVDYRGNGIYDCCRLPYDGSVDRCKTVDKAQKAEWDGKPLVGVFKERFYPVHEFVFVKYKD